MIRKTEDFNCGVQARWRT